MAKRRKDVPGEPAVKARPKVAKRRLRRLERRLERVHSIEARRGRQFVKAHERGVSLEERIAGLRPVAHPAEDGVAASSPGPQAYCMREKRMVSMVDPEHIVMRNGRAALSGTCSSCGAHVVTTAGAATHASVGEGA